MQKEDIQTYIWQYKAKRNQIVFQGSEIFGNCSSIYLLASSKIFFEKLIVSESKKKNKKMKKKGNLIFLNNFSFFDFFGKNVITQARCTPNPLRKIKKCFDKTIHILQFSFLSDQISSTQFRTGLLQEDQIIKEFYEEFI